LPTLWFRNTWAWDPGIPRPRLAARGAPDGSSPAVEVDGYRFGRRVLVGGGTPDLLFCQNESNAERLWGVPGAAPYPKDGINDHVVHGAPSVDPSGHGTKAALRYHLTVPPGQVHEIRLRLTDGPQDLGAEWEETFAVRMAEADQFYASLTPPGASDEVAMIMRQAFAGMLWSKQLYHYAVTRWL